jgi:hypothetical protein
MPVFRNAPGWVGRFRAGSRDGVRREAWKLLWLVPFAAAAVLLFVRPGFRSKAGGENGSDAPRFELVCADVVGSAVQCTRTELLYFWFPSATDHVFLSAYAEPMGGGKRVWFFPTASTPRVELTQGPGPRAASHAVTLADVPPGQYTVHAWLSHEPLEPSDVERGQRLQTASLTVMP